MGREMNHRIFMILILLTTFLPRPVSADRNKEDHELDLFMQKVERQAAAVESFSSNFIQTRYLSIFPRPVKFSGRLVLSRPDRLRWEFSSPLSSVLVLNGRRGIKCDGRAPIREFNLDSDPVMRMVSGQLWAWASGSYHLLREDFDFELLPGPSLVFSPREAGLGDFIQSVRVLFAKDTLHPVEVEINEPGGDRTLISFSDYQQNISPKAELFSECITDL
jgi:outer membrane lipoprotein-sorting protein